jgi:hypothetical protein
MTDANLDIAKIQLQVVQSVGNGDPNCQRGPIVVINLNPLLSIQTTLSIEQTNQLFFLVSMLKTGLHAS